MTGLVARAVARVESRGRWWVGADGKALGVALAHLVASGVHALPGDVTVFKAVRVTRGRLGVGACAVFLTAVAALRTLPWIFSVAI